MLTVSRKCRINGLKPEMALALIAVQQAAANTNHTLTLGHARDGEHSDKSLHYVGYAIDVWVSVPVDQQELDKIEIDLKICLTAEFDLIAHRDGARFTHFHIEFQPKARLDRRIVA